MRLRTSASHAFLRSIIENIPDMIFVKDAAELRFVRLNPAGEKLLGYSREEMIGKNDYDLFPQDEADFFVAKDRGVLEGRALVDIPAEPILTRTQGERILHTKKIPILNDAGEPEYLLGISEDITDKMEIQHALIEARAAAEEASRLKSEFLSGMSHELRTPLNAILGFAQLLEMDLEDKSNIESVQQILAAGRHLLELINDLLDISRIEAGILTISPETVDVGDLVTECIELVEPQADAVEVTLRRESCSSPCIVTADRQRLRQVFLNLLSNAIKFNRPEGSVVVDCSRSGGWISFIITDTGCGIAPENMARLFTPYDRLGAEDSGIEGTGLGLALSKHLCEAMGATLDVTSPTEGGCRAVVRLPELTSC
ncbi:MAG: PAS domain-containing sensor histidine kinase [Microthrixaceae bacterium]|nr:PAS domain-containing sensor histidine kinase [Microthrixaceae bacterium]